MRKLFFILFILILNSCLSNKEKGINFQIRNNSDEAVTQVEFYTSEKVKVTGFEKIEPGQRVSEFLSMKDNRADGSYVLDFTRANEKKEHFVGGYYTNGASLNRWIQFEITNDSILVKFR
jgi:hypothetical protein